MQRLMTVLTGLLLGIALPQIGAAHETKMSDAEMARKQAALVGAEISIIAKHLQQRPETAIDFSGVSGEYCFETGLGKGAHMTHYAIDPTGTREDIIDFVNADPLLQAGINVDSLPRLPNKLGAMEPNTWYYLPAGGFDPHHGKEFPMPMMVRATNLE